MKLVPKCLSYNGSTRKPPAYTSDGFILPCCWLDEIPETEDVDRFNLKSENLKVCNVESVETIITSDEWNTFFNVLVNLEDSAPKMCKKKCGVHND